MFLQHNKFHINILYECYKLIRKSENYIHKLKSYYVLSTFYAICGTIEKCINKFH